jgi:hypothetical protein
LSAFSTPTVAARHVVRRRRRLLPGRHPSAEQDRLNHFSHWELAARRTAVDTRSPRSRVTASGTARPPCGDHQAPADLLSSASGTKGAAVDDRIEGRGIRPAAMPVTHARVDVLVPIGRGRARRLAGGSLISIVSVRGGSAARRLSLPVRLETRSPGRNHGAVIAATMWLADVLRSRRQRRSAYACWTSVARSSAVVAHRLEHALVGTPRGMIGARPCARART